MGVSIFINTAGYYGRVLTGAVGSLRGLYVPQIKHSSNCIQNNYSGIITYGGRIST